MSESTSSRISRRTFIVGAGAGAAAVGLGLYTLRERGNSPLAGMPPEPPLTPVTPVSYGDFSDLWRERWTWDKVVHSSHTRANCISTCSWDIFVKDGIAWREEQNAAYGHAEGVPDFNPRGCQKGACYTHLMYESSRILHPLRRAGPREDSYMRCV